MNLFRHILVPHDFSDHATRALEQAAELAREHDGRLLVLHVIAPMQPMIAASPEVLLLVPEAQLIRERLRDLKALVARRLRGRAAPPVEYRVAIGDPYRRITEAAREVDSIIMATAGRTGLAHLIIGSVAEKVVRHAPVPVLTLRVSAARAKVRRGRRTARRRHARAARRRV